MNILNKIITVLVGKPRVRPTTMENPVTLAAIIEEYREIRARLHTIWPFNNKREHILARVAKMVEEFGELSDAILTRMDLQRSEKKEKEHSLDVEREFADVLGTLILLGIELDIDMEKAIKEKIAFTHKRFEEIKKEK